MSRPVTDDFEIVAKSGFPHHCSRVPAHRHRLARKECMVVVQSKAPGMIRDCAEVIRYLTVVFAYIFEACQFERADCHRYELDPAYPLLNFRIPNRDTLAGNDAVVETPQTAQKPAK